MNYHVWPQSARGSPGCELGQTLACKQYRRKEGVMRVLLFFKTHSIIMSKKIQWVLTYLRSATCYCDLLKSKTTSDLVRLKVLTRPESVDKQIESFFNAKPRLGDWCPHCFYFPVLATTLYVISLTKLTFLHQCMINYVKVKGLLVIVVISFKH